MSGKCKGIGIGTCIVGVLSPEEFVIGADSLRRFEDGDEDNICKIIQVGNLFFTSSGLNIASDKNFNIQEICKQAIIVFPESWTGR